MIIDIIGEEVFLKPDNNKCLYGLINDLNSKYIPYKSYCGTMVVLTYAVWLNTDIKDIY